MCRPVECHLGKRYGAKLGDVQRIVAQDLRVHDPDGIKIYRTSALDEMSFECDTRLQSHSLARTIILN